MRLPGLAEEPELQGWSKVAASVITHKACSEGENKKFGEQDLAQGKCEDGNSEGHMYIQLS